jgi:thioredoxin-like negative regulator of GroEL
MARFFRSAIWVALLVVPATAWSQQSALTRAFDLERRGDYAGAAAVYRTLLADKPADISALLGLERSLLPLNQSSEILPAVRAALRAAPSSSSVYAIALRAWAAAKEPDSVRATAERWARIAPTEEAPYREWGAAELGNQNRAGAKEAYLQGRDKLGRLDAMSAELAQLYLSEANYRAALQEWLLAVRGLPGYRATAVATLSQTPEAARPDLLNLLGREPDLVARRIEADLRARWGDPVGAFRILAMALPSDRVQAIAVLRGLLDQLRTLRSPEAHQVQGRVLEEIAARSPEMSAGRLRLEAAQAYTAGGDRAAARRMLGGLADDQGAPQSVASDAGTTLVNVLISEGKLDEASKRLEVLRPRLRADEYESLRRGVAVGWLRAGDLVRAAATIARDSSIDGLAVAGRIRLYQGDIKGAVELLKAAGPYAGDRAEATHRTTLLALLQPLERDSMPALGSALLQLERGDTAAAIGGLERSAADLAPERGGAELRLLAGRLSAATGKPGEAERLFRAAAVKDAPSTVPAANLALAELLISSHREDEAVQVLEQLILAYPKSALVPQARRKLDEARGAVPRT